MHINIKAFLKDCGLDEKFYPGKRFVKKCAQPGEFKSHSIIYDWSDPSLIRVEVKAGLSRDRSNLVPQELAKYPVSLQAETFFEIDATSGEVIKRSSDEGEEESGGSKGKSGGKGQKKGKKKKSSLSAMGFAQAVIGDIPEAGELTKVVIMGMEIAKEAFEPVLKAFVAQAEKSKIVAGDLLSKAGKFITTYQPAGFLEAKGTEDAPYEYDSEKNQPMFGMNLS